MNPAKPCSVCGEACKTVGACRSLRLPPDGFYTGGGGGGGHSHDDDDEHASFFRSFCDEGRRLITHLFCVDEFLIIAHQPFAQTCSQDDEVPPTQPTRVSVLQMIPNTPSNVAV